MVYVSWLVVAAPGPVLDDATVIQLDPQNQGFCVFDLKKPWADLLKIREWPLIPLRVLAVKSVDVKPSNRHNPKNTTPCRP